MVQSKNASTGTTSWTSTQAYVLATICLVVGIAVGYLLRGSLTSAAAQTASSAPAMPMGSGQVTPEQLKHMADKQAESLLAQLKSSPNDPKLLAQVGNLYYDTQQYKDAIDYYRKSLQADPKNPAVRTDMGTSYWLLGDADHAIAAFTDALKYAPNWPTALFNRGVVKWRGKMDVKGAVADWEALLKANPDYQERTKIEQLISEVKMHASIKPAAKTDKPGM